jgi:hypothetical protein
MKWKHVGIILLDVATALVAMVSAVGLLTALFASVGMGSWGDSPVWFRRQVIESAFYGVVAVWMMGFAAFFTQEMVDEWRKSP